MKLATYATISRLSPIPGANRIEKATVLGWDAVVRKGEFSENDVVIFVFPDTWIPKRLIDSNASPDDRVRLKTVRLRGQYSAGLILPVSIAGGCSEEDLAARLGIEKYEPPLPAQLAGKALGSFPTHLVPKTDEDNIRSNPEAWAELEDPRFNDAEFVLTLKYDGTSATFVHNEQTINKHAFRVCSRNLELAWDEKNTYCRIATQYNLPEKMRQHGIYAAIQGEIIGESIQGNNLGIKGQEFRVFLARNTITGNWLTWDELKDMCKTLGIPVVREIARYRRGELPTPGELQELVNELRYSDKSFAEGAVLRTVSPISSNALNKSWWSVKIMNEPYDMKKQG